MSNKPLPPIPTLPAHRHMATTLRELDSIELHELCSEPIASEASSKILEPAGEEYKLHIQKMSHSSDVTFKATSIPRDGTAPDLYLLPISARSSSTHLRTWEKSNCDLPEVDPLNCTSWLTSPTPTSSIVESGNTGQITTLDKGRKPRHFFQRLYTSLIFCPFRSAKRSG